MGWGRGEPGQRGNQQHASGVEHGADAEAVGKDPAEEEAEQPQRVADEVKAENTLPRSSGGTWDWITEGPRPAGSAAAPGAGSGNRGTHRPRGR